MWRPAGSRSGGAEMFSAFMLNAWIAGAIVAVTAGVVGFFVVVRGASFAAHALPLSAFPGAAAALLLGVAPVGGMVVFGCAGVLAIVVLGRHGRPEVATALTLVMLLATGTLLLAQTHRYAESVYALLFGQILGVGPGELRAMAAAGAVAVVAALAGFRPLLLGAVSGELVAARGVRAEGVEVYFLALLAFAAATAVPVVGALLTFALMVGPASLARAVSARPAVALAASVAIALAVVFCSVALSWATDWPVGFFVGMLGLACYAAGRVRLR